MRLPGPAAAPGHDLDGPPGGGGGRRARRADLARGLLPPRRGEPRLVPCRVQGDVGPGAGAGDLRPGRPRHAAGIVRPQQGGRGAGRRLLERVFAGPARPAVPHLVPARARSRRPRRGPAARARPEHPARGEGGPGLRGRHRPVPGHHRGAGVRGRDGGDARRRRAHGGRGLRRRGHGRAGVRGVRAAQRGPDDARRVPPARRPRWVAAREPRIRLRREPEMVA